MKKLALGAIFAGLAACGGGSSSTKPMLVDSSTGDGDTGQCNPLTQTGCNAGEKCNWIYDQLPTMDMPMLPTVGHIGCEMVNAAPKKVGEACGPAAIGPDACDKGLECVSQECKQVCDNQGGTPMCDADHACVQYQNLYTQGTTTIAGVCDPGCDPLTQDLKVGTNKTACGSTDPTMPNKGCYGYEEYSCSGAAPTVSRAVAVTLTDRQPPAGNYLNACAPGFMPILISETGMTTGLCNGLCAALEVDNTTAHAGNEVGDATASAKTPTGAASAVGNATCQTAKRGSATDGPETCRFLWIYNVDDAGMLNITDYTDKIGVCFARQKYKYDSNGDGTLNMMDMNVPACATLPPRSTTTTGDYDDAADFFCQKVANSMFLDHAPKKGDKVYVGENLGMESARMMKTEEGIVPNARHQFVQ